MWVLRCVYPWMCVHERNARALCLFFSFYACFPLQPPPDHPLLLFAPHHRLITEFLLTTAPETTVRMCVRTHAVCGGGRTQAACPPPMPRHAHDQSGLNIPPPTPLTSLQKPTSSRTLPPLSHDTKCMTKRLGGYLLMEAGTLTVTDTHFYVTRPGTLFFGRERQTDCLPLHAARPLFLLCSDGRKEDWLADLCLLRS